MSNAYAYDTFIHLPTYLPTFPKQLNHLHTYLSVYPPTRLSPTYQPIYIHTYPPNYQPTFLHVYPSVRIAGGVGGVEPPYLILPTPLPLVKILPRGGRVSTPPPKFFFSWYAA